ncbi:MAG: hypothetical protein ABMA25_04975 [Ilumatobacteraceae bacterium]
MANHPDRLARRQRANEELQARLAARNAAFDALDVLDAALASLATVATGAGDPLTRAERVRVAVAKMESAAGELRARAEELRTSERAKANEVAELLGVPATKLVVGHRLNREPSPTTTRSPPDGAQHPERFEH